MASSSCTLGLQAEAEEVEIYGDIMGIDEIEWELMEMILATSNYSVYTYIYIYISILMAFEDQ